jgi:hypothetical protein
MYFIRPAEGMRRVPREYSSRIHKVEIVLLLSSKRSEHLMETVDRIFNYLETFSVVIARKIQRRPKPGPAIGISPAGLPFGIA